MRTTVKLAALAATAAIAGCGGAAAAHTTTTVRVHGTFAESSLADGNCGLSPGDQVKITAGTGRVLATPLLGTAVTKTIHVSGISVPVTELPYSATVPAESRYGLTTGSMPVYYATQSQLRHGVDLSC